MKPFGPLILLAISAFWACIAGGYIPLEAQPLDGNPLFLAIHGDAAVPVLSHALIFLPIAAALIWVLAERQIQQIPTNRVALPLTILFALIIGTAPLSLFKAATLPQVAEWLSYGAAFFAVVASGGRKQGPQTMLAAICGGCALVAVLGIQEYGNNKAIDPTWRIFATWVGPNALAGMLVIGFLVGLGLMLTLERVQALVAGLACTLIGFALFLTQSKGGVGAMAVGILAFGLAAVVWNGRKGALGLVRVAAVICVVALMVVGLTAFQKQQTTAKASAPGGAAVNRFTDVSGSQEQSFEFRRLLWQSAVDLVRENPAGHGAGTFRYWSARPGLTTQTQLAHQSYLQLAVESSAFAPIALFAGLLMWVVYLFRGGRGVPTESRFLRAGVFAAVVAISAHSLLDSDLHYYGIGLVFFMLLGLGLLLSADAVAPEFTPKGLRFGGIAATVLVWLALLYCGYAEMLRSQAVTALSSGNAAEATDSIDALKSVMPFDGDAWYMASLVDRNPMGRLESLQKAVALYPSTRYLRSLARTQAQNGSPEQARNTYERALAFDPNNLPALYQILQLDQARGDLDSAKRIARKLVGIEDTQYFSIRSIPDLIPLETARARVFLAKDERDKTSLLEGALKLYKQYAVRTVPQILMSKKNGNPDYGGQNVDTARQAMMEGKEVATDLISIYRAAGRDASDLETDAKAFDAALGSLR